MLSHEEIENLKKEYELKAIEKRYKLENEWDSAFFMNSILSITEFDIDPWRIHIKLNGMRYVSLYFDNPNDVSCIFNPLKYSLNFRLYNNGTILQYFSTTGRGNSKTDDEILIYDLEDKETAFALSTIYEDIPLMVRYLALYKNLNILREAIYKDIKDLSYMQIKNNNELFDLENYRCLLSI